MQGLDSPACAPVEEGRGPADLVGLAPGVADAAACLAVNDRRVWGRWVRVEE